jgi:hypothetical protein
MRHRLGQLPNSSETMSLHWVSSERNEQTLAPRENRRTDKRLINSDDSGPRYGILDVFTWTKRLVQKRRNQVTQREMALRSIRISMTIIFPVLDSNLGVCVIPCAGSRISGPARTCSSPIPVFVIPLRGCDPLFCVFEMVHCYTWGSLCFSAVSIPPVIRCG